MRRKSTALSVDDAVRLVGVLITAVLHSGEVWFRGALEDAIQEWPDTDWRAVVEHLRDPDEDAGKIADWLEQELAAEAVRQAKIKENS